MISTTKNDLEVYRSGTVAEALALAQADIDEDRRKQAQADAEAAVKHAKIREELERSFWQQMGRLGDQLTPFLVDQVFNPNYNARVRYLFRLPDGTEITAYINESKTVSIEGPEGDGHGTRGMVVRDNMSEADLRLFGHCLRAWRRGAIRIIERQAKQQLEANWRAAVEDYAARAQEALADLQARIDARNDFYTFRLVYRPATDEGQCGCGQDWHSISVLDDEPDEDGWWTAVYNNGQTIARRIYHPVTLDEPEHHIPSKSRLARIIERPGGAKVRVAPRMEPEALAEIEAEMDRIVEALGPVPVHPFSQGNGDEAEDC